MNCERIAFEDRRDFLSTAVAFFATSVWGYRCFGNQDDADGSLSGKREGHCLLIHQSTFASQIKDVVSLADTITLAGSDWGFGGFELSLLELLRISGGDLSMILPKLSERLEKSTLERTSPNPLKIGLAIDCEKVGNPSHAIRMVARHLDISWFSVAPREEDFSQSLGDEVSHWISEGFAEVRDEPPRIILEVPRIGNGLELVRLAKSLELVPSDVGVLIDTEKTLYRFDFAVSDMLFAMKRTPDSNNSKRSFSARVTVNVDSTTSYRKLAYEREMYHMAISDSLSAPQRSGSVLEFLSLKSSTPISWSRSEDRMAPTVIDSPSFNDAILEARRDLQPKA